MIRMAEQTKPNAQLIWTADGQTAFELLKNNLASAPALASPDYSKPFPLYVSERRGFASAVLMQPQHGIDKQPVSQLYRKVREVSKG